MSASSYNVCLIGLGSIGVSFAALHLRYGDGTITVFDTRSDLKEHIESVMPVYLGSDTDSPTVIDLQSQGRLKICSSLKEACAEADIIQEQGPEQLDFKRKIWAEIEKSASPRAHFWTSTSGIAASLQNELMQDQSRLLVVHPFNPPHIMPLIEIVPSPQTSPGEIEFAQRYFTSLRSGHRPVVIKKELPGFVGNRIAYIIFREAAYLVKEGVVGVEDLDTILMASLGPRFAVQGPFKAYHMGGGVKGIRGFMDNLGTTIQDVWDSYEYVNLVTPNHQSDSTWLEKVIKETESAYGLPTPAEFNSRDMKLRQVINTQK
ncbi:unnamed protein product [Clonostachys solani]|uniref:L-gulonate 3-dehydrogenase n=1 Tax=Clonostachys solani TaxID=160281 RepID=A0A9N9ZIA1_9HYPO|nr:unnamed protein product [Clonostachys solani]